MRLTLVCQDLRPWRSGQDVAVWRLARALARRPDVTLTVVTGRVHAGAAVPGARIVRLPCLPLWHFSLQFLSFRLAWAIYRRFHRADVVLASSPLWGGADLAVVHFLSLDWQATAKAPRLADGGGSWARHWHDRFRHALAARLERACYARAARLRRPHLLPVSAALRDSLRRRFDVDGTVVPNIVDADKFHPAPEPTLAARLRADRGWPADTRILLFVGGAWRRKRLDRAIEALVHLPETVELVVLGRGPAAEMRAFAGRLGVAARVAFLGNRADVARFYRIATAVVVPSDYETDSLVAWEALASGVPVVAAPFPASSAWLRPGVTGFPACAPGEIAAAVARLLADPALRARMGAAGRRLAQTRGPAGVADQVVRLARGDA